LTAASRRAARRALERLPKRTCQRGVRHGRAMGRGAVALPAGQIELQRVVLAILQIRQERPEMTRAQLDERI
jgi:hypothetical protein